MTTITEIAPETYRISTYVPEANLGFSQFLVRDEEPLLFHTGGRALFPLVHEAVSKIIDLGARRLQFRADVINAFNHTQFLDVNTSCVGTTTCGSSFGRVTSARPPREIQLGVRFDW